MFGQDFALNETTLSVIEEIGQHMPGGFFIFKVEGDGELLYANQAVFDLFGCDSQDAFRSLTSFTFRGMLPSDDAASVFHELRQQMEESRDRMASVEFRVLAKGGAVRWVDARCHYTGTKAYRGIVYVFLTDITAKRERMETDMAVRQAVIEALSESYHTVWLINDVETGTSLSTGEIQKVRRFMPAPSGTRSGG